MDKKKALIVGGIAAAVVIIGIIIAVVVFSQPAPEPAPEAPAKEAEDAKAPDPVSLVYPLTGLPAKDAAAVNARVLSVKIENSPEARPQLGISYADVVYESITEGGISRFNCLFQSNIPSDVGPVRSGRNSDVTLVPQYNALFFMSGANPLVESQITDAGIADMYHQGASGIYYRVDYREAPHNLYLSLGAALATAESLGISIVEDPARKLDFIYTANVGKVDVQSDDSVVIGVAEETPVAVGDATSITVPFSDYFNPNWAYNPDSKTYARFLDGPTIDAANNQQVAVTNVVVLWADYIPVDGGPTFAVDMNSGGRASIFYDGKRFDGTWSSDGKNPPRFKDASGMEIKLMPGKTWISIQSNGADIAIA